MLHWAAEMLSKRHPRRVQGNGNPAQQAWLAESHFGRTPKCAAGRLLSLTLQRGGGVGCLPPVSRAAATRQLMAAPSCAAHQGAEKGGQPPGGATDLAGPAPAQPRCGSAGPDEHAGPAGHVTRGNTAESQRAVWKPTAGGAQGNWHRISPPKNQAVMCFLPILGDRWG